MNWIELNIPTRQRRTADLRTQIATLLSALAIGYGCTARHAGESVPPAMDELFTTQDEMLRPLPDDEQPDSNVTLEDDAPWPTLPQERDGVMLSSETIPPDTTPPAPDHRPAPERPPATDPNAWTRALPTPARQLVVDAEGNPLLATYDSAGATVTKYGVGGSVTWRRTFADAASSSTESVPRTTRSDSYPVLALTTDGYGHVYAAVRHNIRKTVWLSQGKGSYPVTESQSDTWVLKYSTDGEFLWQLRYGGEFYPTSLATDGAGNLYAVGSSYVDGRGLDLFVIQYDPEGVERWYREYGTDGDEYPAALLVDGEGIVRILASTSTFDPSIGYQALPFTVTYDAGDNELVSHLSERTGYTPGFADNYGSYKLFDGSGNIYQTLRDPGISSSELHSDLQVCSGSGQTCIQAASVPNARLLGLAASAMDSVLAWASRTPNDGRSSVYDDDRFLVEYRSDLQANALRPLPAKGAQLIAVDNRGHLFAAGCDSLSSNCYVTKVPVETLR